MELLMTDLQVIESKLPTRLEVLTELNLRGGLVNAQKCRNDYLKLKSGFEGERILLEYLEEYSEKHWVVLQNVWLNFFGGFECDVLLVTRAGLYPFEVKNYSGTFVLKENVGINNGIKLGKHPVTQGLNTGISMNAIFKEMYPAPNILTTLIFIGSNSQIAIYDEVPDLNILVRNQLKDFIWDIKQTERYFQGKPLAVNDVVAALRPYEIHHLYPAENLTAQLKDNITPGIKCVYCGRFDVKIGKKYVSCRCGVHESRDEALVRTICEYGVMHFDRNLTTTELVEFFGDSVSRSNIRHILRKYFKKDGTYRSSKTVNPGLPFLRIYDTFEFQI